METAEKRDQASPVARAIELARRELGLTSIIVMAVVGLAISGYLTAVHYAKVPLACSTTGLINCAAVTSSVYSMVPGTVIPIVLPGILWFIVSGALASVALARVWMRRPDDERLRVAQILWGAMGLIFVLYLVYAEIVALHKFCEWCTVVHLLTFGTFLVALKRWQDAQTGAVRRRTMGAQSRDSRSRGSNATVRTSQSGARHGSSGRSR